MKKIHQYLVVGSLLAVCSISCHQPTGPSGIWFYTYSSGPKDNDGAGLNPANFLVLKEDGQYTMDFGKFSYGKWEYRGDQLLLTDQQNEKRALRVNYLTRKDMQIGPAAGPLDNFERQPASTGDENENPFSLINNRWRIRASAKETDQQLKERLANHFQFWERYFSWAMRHKIDYIDVRSTPTAVKIYGNGFTLKPLKELPNRWINCFFDQDDCIRANEIISKAFTSGQIAWPHSDNRFVMFIGAFQQLEKIIKK
ncbi:MAG: hypothetical protein KGO82_18180 [Bacteroidota bacterium]|nr:hypothetical protein [Bacteroidota bacterium]